MPMGRGAAGGGRTTGNDHGPGDDPARDYHRGRHRGHTDRCHRGYHRRHANRCPRLAITLLNTNHTTAGTFRLCVGQRFMVYYTHSSHF